MTSSLPGKSEPDHTLFPTRLPDTIQGAWYPVRGSHRRSRVQARGWVFMPGLREIFREWFQSVTETRATEARTDELLPPRGEDAPDALEATARMQARAVV